MSSALISADLTVRINAEHEACWRAAGDALTHALNAGELLTQAKEKCQHGQWSQWLVDNFSGSDRTARAYMRIASHREEIEAKRQTTADLTLERALNYIAPRQQKEIPSKSPEELRREEENRLAESALTFDELAQAADAFGRSHEDAFRAYYAECDSPGDELASFEEHTREVEEVRSSSWFGDAVRRVQAEKIAKAESVYTEDQHVLHLIEEAEKRRNLAASYFRKWKRETQQALTNFDLTDDEIDQLRVEAVWWNLAFSKVCRWSSTPKSQLANREGAA